jgi:hypothetical protein
LQKSDFRFIGSPLSRENDFAVAISLRRGEEFFALSLFQNI